MKVRALVFLAIIFLCSLSAMAQETEDRFDLFKQFMDKNATREDLRHLAGLLKESEFSNIARDLAKEYVGIDNDSLPLVWPGKPIDSEKTVGELRCDYVEAIWNYYVNSSKPENYRIVFGFLNEDWGYKPDKKRYQGSSRCWRGGIVNSLYWYLKGVPGVDPEKLFKRDILDIFAKLLKEDRIPNNVQGNIIESLMVHRDPNFYLPYLLDRIERIIPEQRSAFFGSYSYHENFSSLNDDNQEKLLKIAFKILVYENQQGVGHGYFLAHRISGLSGCDISKLEKFQGGDNRDKYFQKIVDAVLRCGKKKGLI